MAFNIGPIDKDCPCKKDCPDRNDVCHGKCKKYLDWRDIQDAKLDEKNKRQASYDTMSDAKKRAIWKKMRNSRKVRYNRVKDS